MQGRLTEICTALRDRAMSVKLTKQQDAPMSLAESDAAPDKPPPRGRAPATPAKPAPKSERRKVPRYSSDLPAAISAPGKGTGSDVTLITLSVLGGCLEGSGLPEAGQPCELSAEWQGRQLKIKGTVAWNRDGKSVGITFAAPDEDALKLVRQICSNLRLQPMGAPPQES